MYTCARVCYYRKTPTAVSSSLHYYVNFTPSCAVFLSGFPSLVVISIINSVNGNTRHQSRPNMSTRTARDGEYAGRSQVII